MEFKPAFDNLMLDSSFSSCLAGEPCIQGKPLAQVWLDSKKQLAMLQLMTCNPIFSKKPCADLVFAQAHDSTLTKGPLLCKMGTNCVTMRLIPGKGVLGVVGTCPEAKLPSCVVDLHLEPILEHNNEASALSSQVVKKKCPHLDSGTSCIVTFDFDAEFAEASKGTVSTDVDLNGEPCTSTSEKACFKKLSLFADGLKSAD